MYEGRFPPGTPVRIRQIITDCQAPLEHEVVGIVEQWAQLPTGSWYAHGKNDKLWLSRLTLRKMDGELSQLVIDNATTIAKLEAVQPVATG